MGSLCRLLFVFSLLCHSFTYANNGQCFGYTTENKYVTVEVEQGTLRGQEKTSEYFPDKKYYSFEGIPYAKPPVGPLRFKDPEEPEPWSGVRDALGKKDDYEQGTSGLKKYSENPKATDDCLYLNVYTPQIGGGAKPVMVRIHPVAFGIELPYTSEFFGPGHYIVEDVILVSLRYRDGVLGFLCLDHEEVPGNAGLKDQVMALKWVQKNIANFSGDPDNVTLIGISIGGAFIHYHLLSPLSRGLFHRVIIQSGNALSPYSYTPKDIAVKRAFQLGKELGWDTNNTDELLKYLRQVPVTNLPPAATKILQNVESVLSFGLPFTPCIEVPVNNKSFLSLPPRILLKAGQFTKVPTIFGITNMEEMVSLAVTRISDEDVKKENEKLEKHVPRNMGLREGSEEYKQVATDIKRFYFGDKPLSRETQSNYVKLFCDLFFNLAFDEAVRLQLENTQDPVYVFQFNMFKLETPLMWGESSREGKSDAVYDKLTKMWITFAKTGNTNFQGIETNWEAARPGNFSHVVIEAIITPVKGRIVEDRMRMWQELYERHPHVY